jgi:hypothetical protein
MNVHQPRRLSPIPRSDDQDSDYGGAADVKNIPFYRPSRKSVDKASFDVPRSAGATHELAALVSQGEVPVYVPLRSRYVGYSLPPRFPRPWILFSGQS